MDEQSGKRRRRYAAYPTGRGERLGFGERQSFDHLIRKPWHAGEHVELFVGVGGMVRQHALHSELLRERATQTHEWTTGPMVQMGSVYWLSPHWGMTAEVEYIQDLHNHVHELEGLAGMLYRFGSRAHHETH